MNELTFCIAYLNEQEQLEKTLESIRNNCGNKVDIIVIDDASYNNYDHSHCKEKYNVNKWITHTTRQGSSLSKHEAVMLSETPYFMFCDSHIRLMSPNFAETLVNHIKSDPECIYCTGMRQLTADSNDEPIDNIFTQGAYANHLVYCHGINYVLNPKDKHLNAIYTPAVLGSGYAGSKEFFNKIKGFEEHEGYGSEEITLAYKAWLYGNGCKSLRDVYIGHIFRKNGFPYIVQLGEPLYNLMATVYCCCPEDEFVNSIHRWATEESKNRFTYAFKRFVVNLPRLVESRKYYNSIQKRSYSDFVKFNEEFIKYNNIKPRTKK